MVRPLGAPVSVLYAFMFLHTPSTRVACLAQSQLESKSAELSAASLRTAVLEERLKHAQSSLSAAQADVVRSVRTR